MGRISGTILGLVLIGFGLWGIIGQEYSTEGYPWRGGLDLEGYPALIVGIAALLCGIYAIYVVITHRD
jgi:hypothetical protein